MMKIELDCTVSKRVQDFDGRSVSIYRHSTSATRPGTTTPKLARAACPGVDLSLTEVSEDAFFTLEPGTKVKVTIEVDF